MRPRKLLLSLLIATAALPVATTAATPAPSTTALSTPAPSRLPVDDATAARATEDVDALANAIIGRGVPGLAVAVVHGDRTRLARGYGRTGGGGGERIDENTVFRIASLSKGFAGTLAGLLVEDGALRWDMPLDQQLPTFQLADAAGSTRLTVRDALAHRFGLKYHTYDRDLEGDTPYPLLAARLNQAPMLCAPGECFGYQNVAFSLIGDVVFAVTGDFYTRQVEERLFTPLGMENATFGRDGLEGSERWARPHVRAGRGWAAVRPRENYYRVPPAAGINASITDMAIWAKAQLGHHPEVLSPAMLADLHTPLVQTPDQLAGSPWRRARLRDAHYGTGWRVFDYDGEPMVYHAGAVQGYRGMIALLPRRDIGIVVLWNSESALPSGLMPTFFDRVLGLPDGAWVDLVNGR
ncbi:MAG: serine hydrolase domain-containing protein [Silanimonas sp.]